MYNHYNCIHPIFQFDVWSLIKRRGKEHPFCMEAKFRAGKRLHRLDSTIVTRKRKQVESEVEVDDDASSISSSGSSTDWLNSDDEEEGGNILFLSSLPIGFNVQ